MIINVGFLSIFWLCNESVLHYYGKDAAVTYIPGLHQTLYSSLVLQMQYNPQSVPSEVAEKIYKNDMTMQPSSMAE